MQEKRSSVARQRVTVPTIDSVFREAEADRSRLASVCVVSLAQDPWSVALKRVRVVCAQPKRPVAYADSGTGRFTRRGQKHGNERTLARPLATEAPAAQGSKGCSPSVDDTGYSESGQH